MDTMKLVESVKSADRFSLKKESVGLRVKDSSSNSDDAIEIGSSQIVYRADLQRVGSIISESFTVLAEYSRLEDWDRAKEAVIFGNLLNKRSSQTLNGILAAIRKRYYANYRELPCSLFLAKAIAKNVSRTIKTQLLYPYVCESDHLVKDILLSIVARKIGRFSMTLAKREILEYLEDNGKSHRELEYWSELLRARWTRGFLAFLRDFGIMEKPPGNDLIKPIPRVESFAFFMLGLLEQKPSVVASLRSEVWRLFFLNDTELEHLLVDMQERGWVHYHKTGEILELKPKYRLERWLNEELE